MGWFSAKKKVYVSSVVYNLAGGPEDRVKYLPTTIATHVVSNSNFSLSDTLQKALIDGPGMRMRRFARWARTSGYTEKIGQSTGQLSVGNSINLEEIIGQIPVDPGYEVSVQDAKIGDADYGAWADQWMLLNHPERVDDEYEIDFDESTNTIYIWFTNGSDTFSFNPVGFDVTKPYLYVSYTISVVDAQGPIVPGTVIPVGSPTGFPDIEQWHFVKNTDTPKSLDLTKTVLTKVTYSDETPPESDETEGVTSFDYTESEGKYDKTEYNGESADGSEITSTNSWLYLYTLGSKTSTEATETTEETLPGGVIKTTTVTTTTESFTNVYKYRIDTQHVIDRSWSVMQTIIYKKGDGNPVFDAMFNPSVSASAFLPFIPVRIDNRMIDDNYFGEIYPLNKKALTRATGSSYTKLVESLEVNPSLRDIDYGYISFGAALNTKEDVSKKYIYKFFQHMLLNAGSGADGYSEWRTQWNLADQSQRNWLAWKDAQSNPASPLYGRPEPTKLTYPTEWGNTLQVISPTMNYDIRVHWSSITEVESVGLAWPNARQGQVKIQIGASNNYDQLLVSAGLVSWIPQNHEFVSIIWQDSPTTYRTIGIWNLWHVNMIYKGKAVYTSASAAMIDTDESGFIIPMHEGIYRSMSLVDTSQMSMASGYMVLNCYKVVKQKWYQTSWFKIVLVIIVIVITVLSAGTGAGSAGLLGTAASVGAALGFAGAVAIIVGTIANAVAAMLLTQLLTMGATALFGEKVGAIVGAIASVVAISAGTSMMGGQGMAAGFSNLANAENILKLSVAAGSGLAEYVGAETAGIMQQTQELIDQYGKDSQAIMETWEKNLGLGKISIDPTVLTEAGQNFEYIPERSNVFLSRTLLTGSDIADMTNDLLTNFTKMTLSSELE